MKRLGITRKIALAAGLLGVLSGLIIGLISIYLDSRSQFETMRFNADRVLQATLPQIERAYWEVDFPIIQSIMTSLLDDPIIYRLEVLDPLLTADLRSTSGLDGLRVVEAKGDTPPWLLGTLGIPTGLVQEQTLNLENPRDGSELAQVVVGYSYAAVYSGFVQQSWIVLLTSIFQTLLVTSVIFLAIQITVIRPIANLQAAALRAREGRRFELRGRDRRMLDTDRKDEISRLARDFHRTVSELENSRDTLQATVEERTKELTEARNEALAASRAKSSFLANMSHEFRTPLNAINGLAELLQQDDRSQGSLRNLHDLRTSVRHLSENIESVLDLSKIETGQMQLEHVWFSLSELLDDVIVQTRALLTRDDPPEFVLKLSSDLPHEICSDPLRLRQILVNFTSNAVKFTPYGSISLDVRAFWLTDESAELYFCVKDTGIGISEDKIDEVFEPFGQAEKSTTRNYGGTGLGLSIAKRISQLMQGSVSVDSAPGKGSVFGLQAKFSVRKLAREPSAERYVAVLDNGGPIELIKGMFGRSSVRTTDLVKDASCIVAVRTTDVVFSWPSELLPSHSIPLPITHKELVEATYEEYWKRPSKETTSLNLAGRDILIVEDNEISLRVFEDLTTALGANVRTAMDGLDALDQISQRMPDLILMDLRMPRLDGHKTLERLHNLYPGRVPPVIAMSADATPADERRCLAAGFRLFLPKPIDPNNLREALINILLDHGVWIDEDLGLLYAGGSRALFERNLQDFRKNLVLWKRKLETLVAQPDPEAAADLLHVVKGAAGTIGASQLSRTIEQIEDGLLKIDAMLAALSGTEKVLNTLDDKAFASTTKLDQMSLDTLETRITAREVSALELIDKLHAEPDDPQQQQLLAELSETLHSMDFSAADGVLAKLIEITHYD